MRLLPPGARFHYSNLAFALLGIVVERVSGVAYRQYVEDRLLRPLGRQDPHVAQTQHAGNGCQHADLVGQRNVEPCHARRARGQRQEGEAVRRGGGALSERGAFEGCGRGQGVPGQPRPGLQRPAFQNRPALPRRPPALPKGKKEKR